MLQNLRMPRADFLSKLGIALKEASETKYWLRLLRETGYLSGQEFDSIYPDCVEVEKLLVSIIKSAKKDSFRPEGTQ